MVQVRQSYSITNKDGSFNVDSWLSMLPGFELAADREKMMAACRLASEAQPADISKDTFRAIGCFDAGLEMVRILADLHMDEETLLAAIVYRAVREEKNFATRSESTSWRRCG